MNRIDLTIGIAWASPWWLALAVTAWRWRGSPSLDDVAAAPPVPTPRVSVIVPARNEAKHIAQCIASILASNYPNLEVVVVDDHSTDGTAALARAAVDRAAMARAAMARAAMARAAVDHTASDHTAPDHTAPDHSPAADERRITIITPPPLPAGWLGKQWACHHGALGATGDILLFTDADVRHAPDLHTRIVNTIERENADLVSVAGRQEALTFWERIAQPFVFSVMAQAFGGPGAVNRSRRRLGKIANGQCLAFRRSAYDAFGGHAAVRGRIAEDLAFAQDVYASGFRTFLTLGMAQMSTRMYGSLGEIVAGWGKNVYAGGRELLPGGPAMSAVARVLVPLPAVWSLLPPLALVSTALGAGGARVAVFGAVATAALLVWFLVVTRRFGISLHYALLFPLGALVYLYIALGAVFRGDRVRWKDRAYSVTPGKSGSSSTS